MRSRHDAILVGINTVIQDNPSLTSHGLGKNPVRVVIDPHLKIPLSSHILNNEAPTVIFTTRILKVKVAVLRKRGIIVNQYQKGNKIDFKYIIKELNIMSIYSLLIEGGGETIGSAIEDGIVDEIAFFLCPKIIGGRDAITPVEGLGAAYVARAKHVRDMKILNLGHDILITGKISQRLPVLLKI